MRGTTFVTRDEMQLTNITQLRRAEELQQNPEGWR